MHIAFVDGNGKRVMIVNMGSEVESMIKMTPRACAFIRVMCDSMGWTWEPVEQPRANSRIVSFEELRMVLL